MEVVRSVAGARFARERIRVPPEDQGLRYAGLTLGSKANPLTYHLVKRVARDAQWASGTTAEQYLRDLQAAVRAPRTRIAAYETHRGLRVVTLTPTRDVINADRLGPDAGPLLLVSYSPRSDTLLTGYQIMSAERANIPPRAVWLQ